MTWHWIIHFWSPRAEKRTGGRPACGQTQLACITRPGPRLSNLWGRGGHAAARCGKRPLLFLGIRILGWDIQCLAVRGTPLAVALLLAKDDVIRSVYVLLRTVPWLRRFDTGLPLRRPRFHSRAGYVRFCGVVSLGQAFSPSSLIFACRDPSAIAPYFHLSLTLYNLGK